MRKEYIFLTCVVMLLSGCAAPIIQPSERSIGKTYEQLVRAKRADVIIRLSSPPKYEWKTIDGWNAYYCYFCDGKPTRTYTNPAGNTVVAYFYYVSEDHVSAPPPYSICLMLEERYELRDNIVVAQWYFTGEGERRPLYTKNVCDEYDHNYLSNIKDTDPSLKEF
jgi:hypothetical protein